jgi:hypothetical protein
MVDIQKALTAVGKAALESSPGYRITLALWNSISGSVSESVASSEEVTNRGDLAEMRREAERQELSMLMAERQARVSQELAIGSRIASAETVEIEEHYEYFGKGQAGLAADANTAQLNFGLSGEGKRVSRRIYRFKGMSQTFGVEIPTKTSTGEQPESGGES